MLKNPAFMRVCFGGRYRTRFAARHAPWSAAEDFPTVWGKCHGVTMRDGAVSSDAPLARHSFLRRFESPNAFIIKKEPPMIPEILSYWWTL
jgi:hypothetical protein